MGCPLSRFAAWLLLLAAVALSYARLGELQLSNWDDDQYLAERPQVREGLTGPNVVWAWTSMHVGNRHPLTTMSHQLDCTLFGLDPRWPHIENGLLHLFNTWLLFEFWSRATGHTWRAFAVALLFAVHPLHVENVAWISERKDLLCAFFWLLAMHAWLRYVAKPSLLRYVAVAGYVTLALLSKPMAVTLPVILCLIDVWPLRRERTARELIVEKVPLLLIAAVGAAVTYVAQSQFGAVQTFEFVPLWLRAVNAVRSYGVYLLQLFYPVHLSCFYPLPLPVEDSQSLVEQWLIQGAAALVVIMLISAVVYRWRRSAPYGLIGWLWYLVKLVPVIGLLQVGEQAHADRYAYLPLIGPMVAIVWGWSDCIGRLVANQKLMRGINGALVISLSAVCIWLTRAQVMVWHDSHSLFAHAIAVGGQTDTALFNLGLHEDRLHDYGDAERFYAQAVRLNPQHARAMNNLGGIALRRGKPKRALAWFDQAIATGAEHPLLYANRGEALVRLGRWREAIDDLARATRAAPDDARAWHLLGRARAAQGQLAAALDALNRAVDLGSPLPELFNDRGAVYLMLGRLPEAERDFRASLAQNVELVNATLNLSTVLARKGETGQALEVLRAARAKLAQDSPDDRRLAEQEKLLLKPPVGRN